MLLDIRETVRNSKPLKYTLITIICIPFVLFGVGSYFSGGGPGYVAKVNGEEIGLMEFDRAYSQQRQRLAQMFGGNIPEGFSDEGSIRQQALDGLVSQQVMRNVVADNNFAVSDKTLAQAIQQIPAFQNEGSFDKERYMLQLRSSQMSVDAFENSYREDTALAQLRSGITDSSFQLPTEHSQFESLQNQIRKVDTLTFALGPVKESIEVADADVQTYFDENADNYKHPQRVKIRYIELSTETLEAGVDVSDDEAQEYFEANKGNYVVPEERMASHILITLDEDAKNSLVTEKTELLSGLKERIAAGEDFAALAAEFSEDVGTAENGGSLGSIAPGVMVPEFETAVFALEAADDISDPIRTQFGLHLIKLDEIVPEKGETFDQAKEKIIASIKQETAQREFIDLSEVLSDQAFEFPDSLEAAADATGLEIGESDWLDGTPDTASAEVPALNNPLVLQTALSVDVRDDGNNSEALEIGPDHLLVLRTVEYEDTRPKTLEEVREDVIDTLKTDRAGEQLDTAIAEAIEKVETDRLALASFAEQENVALAENLEVGRRSTELDRGVAQKLFKLKKPEADKPVIDESTLPNGDRILVVFHEVLAGESATSENGESEEPVAENSFQAANPRLGEAEFSVFLETLRSNSTVETNERVMSGEYAQEQRAGGY